MIDDDDTQVYRSELEAAVKAAVAAERERLLSTDIHSCHADCQRFACVQTRRAVEAEREAIAQMVEDAPPLAEFVKNDKGGCMVCGFTPKLAAAAIRARGEKT
jgi:FPC/CPF motif-containing protein YcgG